MGLYVNPPNGETKEDWLYREAEAVSWVAPPSIKFGPGEVGFALVCLVDNRLFTAAGIVDSERELEAFNQPSDRRPKVWFWVLPEKLVEVCPDYKVPEGV